MELLSSRHGMAIAIWKSTVITCKSPSQERPNSNSLMEEKRASMAGVLPRDICKQLPIARGKATLRLQIAHVPVSTLIKPIGHYARLGFLWFVVALPEVSRNKLPRRSPKSPCVKGQYPGSCYWVAGSHERSLGY